MVSNHYPGAYGHEMGWAMIPAFIAVGWPAKPFPTKGPVVGLFADQEIRLLKGPLFVGEDYEIDREVVALSGSRRTESLWIRTRVFKPGNGEVLATMLLNSASLKDSYANYAAELAQI